MSKTYTTEYDVLNASDIIWVKPDDDQSYILLMAESDDEDDFNEPIIVSKEEYLKAMSEYLEDKCGYFNRYESSELGVGYISWKETGKFFEVFEEDKTENFVIPHCKFDYVQMERG